MTLRQNQIDLKMVVQTAETKKIQVVYNEKRKSVSANSLKKKEGKKTTFFSL